MVVCLLQGGSRCLLQYNQTGLCLYFEVNIAFDTFSGRKFCSLELSLDSKESRRIKDSRCNSTGMNIREVSIKCLDLIRFGFKTYILSKTNIQNSGFLLPFVGSYPLECHNCMGK
jgi:hypothetical protein